MSSAPSPDRAPPLPPEAGQAGAAVAAVPPQLHSLGLLELLLPLWHRRWRLLSGLLLGALLGFGLSLLQPLRFTGSASFVVQPLLRPSQSVVASALPALAGLVGGGGGGSAIDLYATMLRSQAMSERIIERFDLQRSWGHAYRIQTQQQLARRVGIGMGRRDGLVQITVQDETPQRAAAIANQYVTELRLMLQAFALDEARQRRQFYELQLARARTALETAQQQLQASGFDRAALRAQPAAAAERYGRLSAEVAAAELRLAATRRVRTDASAEVQQQLAALAALRQQLASLEAPRDSDGGAFVGRLRDFRYAEALAESIARQAEAARVDEAADAVPLQVLDQARPPEWPSSPRPPLWAAAGGLAGLLLAASWVLLRHKQALARRDPAHQQRLALLRDVLAGRG
jgi:uncharacterized protein involved in exopolysaccharide biosynthesis